MTDTDAELLRLAEAGEAVTYDWVVHCPNAAWNLLRGTARALQARLSGGAVALPDPHGVLKCTHPDCGRFRGPRYWECRAGDACAANLSQSRVATPAPSEVAAEVAEIEKRHAACEALGVDGWTDPENDPAAMGLSAHEDRATLLRILRTPTPVGTGATGGTGAELAHADPFPRAGEALSDVVAAIQGKTEFSVADVHAALADKGYGDEAGQKEVHNAIGYLKRRGHLERVKYGCYRVISLLPKAELAQGMVCDRDKFEECLFDTDSKITASEVARYRDYYNALLSSGIIVAVPGREELAKWYLEWAGLIERHDATYTKLAARTAERFSDALLSFITGRVAK